MRFPEVESVFGRIGRATTATDPAPLNMTETVINLKPERAWREGLTQEELIGRRMEREVKQVFRGALRELRPPGCRLPR
jgi:Cu(I)/Ag(I) efflux system membrane protein CusA/SilA